MSLLFNNHNDMRELVSKLASRPEFCIYAEEASQLNNTSFEWSFGNGDDSQSGFGVVLPFDSELLALTLSTRQGSAVVEARKNNDSAGLQVSSDNDTRNSIALADSPILFEAGDVIGFRTVLANGAAQGGKIAAWFKWK